MTIFNIIVPAALLISIMIGLRRYRRANRPGSFKNSEFWAGLAAGLASAQLMGALIVDLPTAIRRGQFTWIDLQQLPYIVGGLVTGIILVVVAKRRKWDQRSSREAK